MTPENFPLQVLGSKSTLTSNPFQVETDVTEDVDIAEYGMQLQKALSEHLSAEEQGRSEAAIALPPVDGGREAWYVR